MTDSSERQHLATGFPVRRSCSTVVCDFLADDTSSLVNTYHLQSDDFDTLFQGNF